MAFTVGLVCRECGEHYPTSPTHTCDLCFGALEVAYDEAAIRHSVPRELIAGGPPSMWRYAPLLPLDRPAVVGFHSGWTPLRRAPVLEQAWGCREIWLKDESANARTLSCKDRFVAVAINKAIELGFTTVACASRGNLGNSLAAYAASANLPCYILVRQDANLAALTGAAVCGARLVRIRGGTADLNRLCAEAAVELNWAFMNLNTRPYYVEGAKTFGLEIAEQLGWRLPDHVVLPVAGGTLLPAVYRGFRQLVALGLVEERPCRVHAAQPTGCAPVVRAIHDGSFVVRAVEPKTEVGCLSVGNPSHGQHVVKTVRESGGWADAASDDDAVESVKMLARMEGVWADLAGGVAVAVTKRLLSAKRIHPEDSIVIGITSHGIRSSDVVAPRLEEPVTIGATMSDFRKFVRTEDELRDAWEQLSTR
jgi:threonine synthase